MLIRRIDNFASAPVVAHVPDMQAAREYLEGLGKVLAFEVDHFAGGADALVMPRGFSVPDQFSVEVVS